MKLASAERELSKMEAGWDGRGQLLLDLVGNCTWTMSAKKWEVLPAGDVCFFVVQSLSVR